MPADRPPQGSERPSKGRAIVISRLIELVGPVVAADLVKAADRKHRMLFENGCENPDCPVCSRTGETP